GINTNYENEVFKRGLFSNHTLSISGGSDKVRFYSSVNLYNEHGTTPNSDMNRVSMKNNFDYSDDKLKIAISSNLGYVKRDFPPVTGFYTNSPFLAFLLAPQYALVNQPDGSYYVGSATKYLVNDVLDQTKYDENYNDQIKATLSVQSSYKLADHLTAALTSGIDFRETQSTSYRSKLTYYVYSNTTPTGLAGSQHEDLARFFSGDVRPSLEYANVFNGKHDVDFQVVGEYIKEFTKGFGLTGYGIDPRTPNTPAAITPGNADNQLYPALSGYKSQNGLLSGMAIGRYTYDSKYTISGSYRYDGSSKLPKDNRWVGFYSIGGVWDAKQEKFLANATALDLLRFRISYGGSGNNSSENFPYGDFNYQPQYSNGTYAGLTTIGLNTAGNPDLTWEKTYTTNFGIDFGLFNDRITGNVDLYDKVTKDMFVNKTLSATSGLGNGGSILVNAGKMSNKGVELYLSGDVVRSRNFVWNLYTNGSYNRNRVESLGGLSSYNDGTSIINVGKPVGAQNEVKFAGIDQATGKALYYTKDGKVTTNYSTDDAVEDYGTWNAPWEGGFGTKLTYKGIVQLDVFFSWQSGASRYDNMQYFLENPSGFLVNGYNQATTLDFWQKPGDVTTSPSPLYATNFSSADIHSASFLRLKDVTLSFLLPKSVIKKIGFISSAKFYIEGSNLFIWTHWKGVDPEAGETNLNQAEFPNPGALTGGITITF
ncbi:MAG TPA: SusC/RagA family TonB-linked outer membrane protein, partial [Arachidicoccus sp.]